VTLGDESVLGLLRDRFVVGWRDIRDEDWVGSSFGYSPGQRAVGTTNGAGARNVQTFVLAPDLTVLHALPGFWHPEDFARELRFALVLARLWSDDNRTRAEKEAMFELLQLAEARCQPEATRARSAWQDFDRRTELGRAQVEARDVFAFDGEASAMGGGAELAMKPLCVLVHERMAERRFLPFAAFDAAAFVDYGQKFYDNNRGLDEGVVFAPPRPKRRSR
jgi:hypothetical protein